MTTIAAQQANGIKEPIVGWLAAGQILPNGSMIRSASSRMRAVESEVIFRMGRDMPAHVGHYSREDVSQAVVAAFAGLEICDSRFKDPNRQPIGNVIADNSYASLIVLGDRLQLEDVASYPVTLTTLAAPATTGNSRAVFGDPMLSLCWLANWLSDRGCGLKAGQYVAAGNCTGLTHADANDRCVARFGDLASVHCAFSA